MKKATLITLQPGIHGLVTGDYPLQCPFKNTYTLPVAGESKAADKIVTADKLQQQQPQLAMAPQPQFCNELCPFFDYDKYKGTVHLHCTGVARQIELVQPPKPEQTAKPLNVVN